MENRQPLNDFALVARSLIDWWSLAGVDCAVSDEPRTWGAGSQSAIAAGQFPSPPKSAIATSLALDVEDAGRSAASDARPPAFASLDAYLAWLAEGSDHPEAEFAAERITPDVGAEADVLLITDMPSVADMAAGRLFSGDEGDLARAMLRAVDIDARTCGMASLLLARPPGGMGDDALWSCAAERIRHLLTLVRPRLLLLFGDRTKRALCGATRGDPGPPEALVNLGDREIRAISMPAAFIMLQQAGRKAAAWKDLRRAAHPR